VPAEATVVSTLHAEGHSNIYCQPTFTISLNQMEEANEEILSGIIEKYDAFAAAMMHLGLIGIWNQHPLVNGEEIKKSILPKIPVGPAFRDVMDEQAAWMTTHPGGSREKLVEHLKRLFSEYS